ncbi:hypothetical protein D9M69_573930 [compost metagenome]
MRQVGRTVLSARRANRDKDYLGLSDAFVEVLAEAQLTTGQVCFEHRLQARLMDRHFAAGQSRYPERIALDADHPIAHFGKACRRLQSDIAGSDHTDSHRCTPLMSYSDCSECAWQGYDTDTTVLWQAILWQAIHSLLTACRTFPHRR